MPDDDFSPTAALNTTRRLTRIMQDTGVTEEGAWQMMDAFASLDEHLDGGNGELPDQWRARTGRPRFPEDGEVLENIRKHGTRASYNKGCHCQRCRKANREYAAARLANQKKEATA